LETNSKKKLHKIKVYLIICMIVAGLVTGCSSGTNKNNANLSTTQLPTTPAGTTTSLPTPTETSVPLVTTSLPTSLPPTVEPTALPTAIFSPSATPYKPEGDQLELFQYMLDIINTDRQNNGLNPVTLNFNAAAQIHAEDMLKNQYLAHWGTDGQKPYMRYTLAGGLNYEQENSALSSSSGKVNVKQELRLLEDEMMNHDEAYHWGHRDNILNKWHKKVSLGVAYDNNSVALVQQFEGDYIEFYQPPVITGNVLSLSGRFIQSGMILNVIGINFDPLPQPISASQLKDPASPYHSYSLDNIAGYVLPPPPPDEYYVSLPPNSIIASKGSTDENGRFYIEADIRQILDNGIGVYTMALVPSLNEDSRNFTNYSIFIEQLVTD
jgi:uncharacterized protein YkwD